MYLILFGYTRSNIYRDKKCMINKSDNYINLYNYIKYETKIIIINQPCGCCILGEGEVSLVRVP